MNSSDFFAGIAHPEVPWRNYTLHVPVFYPDFMSLSLTALVPLAKIKALLPSKRIFPYRVTPGFGTVSITAYQYRSSDLGPYNEISLAVPVSYGKRTRLFTGSLRKPQKPILIYSHWLPVSTEIARVVGKEFAGYPKFIADIQFSEDKHWMTCRMDLEGKHVLTFRGRKLHLRRVGRSRGNPLTFRGGWLLRSELIFSECKVGTSRNRQDVNLVFGDHPSVEIFKNLGFNRIASYTYCPHGKAILTPVIESLSG